MLEPVAELPNVLEWRRIRVIARPVAQVVRDMTRADHEHVLGDQRRECLTDCEMVRRSQFRLHRQLHHRHVALRIHPFERHPRPVIDAAAAVDRRREPRCLQQL